MVTPSELYARVPLFERLIDAIPVRLPENPPLRMLDAVGLQASVARELSRIFNTRRATDNLLNLTLLDYGIPDWSGMYAANVDDRLSIERGIVRAILAFEPRLRDPQAKVDVITERQQSLSVRIVGKIQNDSETWPVAFSVSFRQGHADVSQDQGK